MSSKDKLTTVGSNNELGEARLWKSLDYITDKVTGIDTQLSEVLSEVIRLNERVNNQETVLSRYGNRLDDLDFRQRESEVWQARQSDSSRTLKNVKKELESLKLEVTGTSKTQDVTAGQKDVLKEIFKWIAGVFAAVLVFKYTKGP